MSMVDQLPFFCHFGLRPAFAGGWEADPAGCPMHLTADSVSAHEATCGFALVCCAFAGCGVELRRSAVDAHDAAEAVRHARGEREARLALEASSAARISALSSLMEASTARQEALAATVADSAAAMEALSRRLQPAHWTFGRTLKGHSDRVCACAFSPDGSYVASGSDDYSVKLWDIQTGECLLTMVGHGADVSGVVFSPNGAKLVSCSDDMTLKIWATATGECLHTLRGHEAEVTCCSFSSDGTRIASASADKTVKLWDATTGRCIFNVRRAHREPVRGCAISPDCTTILSCSEDMTLKLWVTTSDYDDYYDVVILRRMALQLTLRGHTASVNACCFSHNGRVVLSASDDGTLKLWSATTGACYSTLKHGAAVNACAFNPSNDDTLLSGSSDATLKLWRIGSGECVQTLDQQGHCFDIMGCAFSPDGRSIISCGEDDEDYESMLILWKLT